MTHRAVGSLPAFLVISLLLGANAHAHPHVWVTMKSEIIYGQDGTVTGIRHAWAFDDMFSTYATQGLETKQKGVFTREDLKPLADVNMQSLKESEYFTHVTVNGNKALLADPTEYYLDLKDAILTLNFTLTFKSPLKSRNVDVEVFDPAYFVDFVFAEKSPVALAGAPSGCEHSVGKPGEMSVADGKKFSEADFNRLANNWGSQFANRLSVRCP